MTDTRLPERFLTDRRIRRLSDAEFRSYVNALVWSVANRTDGVLHDEDLPLIPDVDAAHSAVLAKVELWRRDRARWLIVDYTATQTSKHELEVLDNARRREREKKARQRAAAAADDTHVPGDSPPVRPPGHVPGTAQEGRKAGSEEQNHAGTNARASDANACARCDKHSSFALLVGRDSRPYCRTCHPIHMRDSA
jgi:hypothetical protein